jgi:sugar-specific transcriptional regulator TrmB
MKINTITPKEYLCMSPHELLLTEKDELKEKIKHIKSVIKGLEGALVLLEDALSACEEEIGEEEHFEEWGYLDAQMAKED